MTHIAKLFMRVKYRKTNTFCTLYINNKTPFRLRALFQIFDLLRMDPTSFGGGGRRQGRFAKIQIFAVIRVDAKRGLFHVYSCGQ